MHVRYAGDVAPHHQIMGNVWLSFALGWMACFRRECWEKWRAYVSYFGGGGGAAAAAHTEHA